MHYDKVLASFVKDSTMRDWTSRPDSCDASLVV